VSIAAALLLGAWSVLDGARTHGDLVLFLSYALSLRGPAVDFAWSSSRLGRTLACASRLERLMLAEAPSRGASVGAPVAPLQHALHFDSVALRSHKKLRHGRKWLVDDLSCTIPAGRRVAVFGENGAGKSTLLSLVLRLTEPTRGAVSWDDVPLSTLDVAALRAECSVVLQQSVLPGLSVRDNIALGNPSASEAEVLAAASAAGVDAVVASLPAGYDTVIRRGGDLLSGGERQRIAIARALLRNGSLWLLDEPLTGLDDDAAAAITAVLFARTAGRTTLWITHDPVLARQCDWILELDRGALRYSGPAAGWRTDLPPAPAAVPLTLLRT
jgi:ATP-binding cassette subfamily B protein